MVKSCCAEYCTEKAKKGGLSFHRFPKDLSLRKKWIQATGRDNFNYSESYSFICEKHFLQSDYMWQFGRRILKPGTVPSVFENFRRVKLKKKKKLPPKRPNDQQIEPTESNGQILNSTIPIPSTTTLEECGKTNSIEVITIESTECLEEGVHSIYDSNSTMKKNRRGREPVYFGDYDPDDLESDEARKLWSVANKQIISYKKKLNLLKVKEYRQQQKIKALQNLLVCHMENNKIS